MKKRIWELDALRGLAILAVIAIHLTYDLVVLYDVWDLKDPRLFNFSQDWGGVIFLLISGICVTLGSRPVKRGITVFLCGMIITLVTACMYLLNFTGKDIIIYYGVLHCLGTCMLLWPLFRKCPVWLLAVLGIGMVAAGLYVTAHVRVSFPWLIPLGLTTRSFSSSDYFPLLPNLGYFLIGAALGKVLYRNQVSLLPNVNPGNPILRFLCFCGKYSLQIYLLHQPVLAAIIALLLPLF